VGGAVRALTVVACAAVLAAPATARSERFEDAVLRDINVVRAHYGLPPLRPNAELTAAADVHSREMIRRGFFAHDSADGGVFWRRLLARYSTRGYHMWAVGENLVWSSPDLSAQQAVQDWMNSPPHRENLLSPKFREIGLAADHSYSAPGIYGGRAVTVLTADFGVRR
jgi:uncharacterized protein YkwD